MNNKLKIFLLVILVSMPFWWGMNIFQANLENFLLAREMVKQPPLLSTAQIADNYINTGIHAKINAQNNFQENSIDLTREHTCSLLSRAVMAVSIDSDDNETILFKKQETEQMPIASLTKLMTGLVALENYALDNEVKISKNAVAQPEETGELREGERLMVGDLLKIMLVESSNDAAYSLAEIAGQESFIRLMNARSTELGLLDTRFSNPAGLDAEGTSTLTNYSTASDLKNLGKYLLKKPELLLITTLKDYPLYVSNESLHHTLKNTNELLGQIPRIAGGKTGWTSKAGGCLIIILKDNASNSHTINVVLNSPDRFGDMKKLINCEKTWSGQSNATTTEIDNL